MKRMRARSSKGALSLLTALGIIAGLILAGPAQASTPTCASLGWGPNIYAIAASSGGQRYGVAGNDLAYSASFSMSNFNFTDEAYHVVAGSGLEVGWYIGYGAGTGTYVTSPHAYATLNGPHEVDGPAVPVNSYYKYWTWYSGTTQGYSVTNGSSYVWLGSQAASDSGPGVIIGAGEVNHSGLPMAGNYSGSQYYTGSSWVNWPGNNYCADTGYSISIYSATDFSVI